MFKNSPFLIGSACIFLNWLVLSCLKRSNCLKTSYFVMHYFLSIRSKTKKFFRKWKTHMIIPIHPDKQIIFNHIFKLHYHQPFWINNITMSKQIQFVIRLVQYNNLFSPCKISLDWLPKSIPGDKYRFFLRQDLN